MPSIRIGLSTQFNLENEQVGIGTTNPTATLEVIGNIKAEGAAGGSGVSTFREYQGFHQSEQGIANNIVIDNQTGGPFSSLSADLVISGETTISSGSTVEIGKTKTLTVTDKFAVPLGDTNSRDNTPEAGTTRFNQDFGTLEFFDGNNWKTVNSYSRGSAAGRAIISSGYDSGTNYLAQYDYITISTLGNSAYFGDMQSTLREKMGCGSAIRALFGAGASPSGSNEIDYLTIASAGNGIDFGNLTDTNYHNSALSSSTRGIWGGGYRGPSAAHTNVIEYVEISTIGNALDFGDLSGDMDAGSGYVASCASPTRGVFSGGTHPTSPAGDNVIRSSESITIASKGNSTRFGDLTAKHQRPSAASNTVRGLIFSGRDDVPDISAIDMSSGGVAVYFGELATADYSGFSACNNVRAVHGGGDGGPRTNRIEYVSIPTGGNALEFGDMSYQSGNSFLGSTSDSHGGLGGF
mgnify:CR=1 FL=1